MKVSGQLLFPTALPPGKEPPVPLDRRLGVPQSHSSRESNHGSPAHSIVTRGTELPRLLVTPLYTLMNGVIIVGYISLIAFSCYGYRVKVKLSLCFNWAPLHEGVLGEWSYSSTHSLTSALDGSEWWASYTGRFTPRVKAPGTHWIGGWVGPRAVLDTVVKRKISSPHRELNPGTLIVKPVAQRYTDWAVVALGSLVTRENNLFGYYSWKKISNRLELLR
jgi:hypothetical protein